MLDQFNKNQVIKDALAEFIDRRANFSAIADGDSARICASVMDYVDSRYRGHDGAFKINKLKEVIERVQYAYEVLNGEWP